MVLYAHSPNAQSIHLIQQENRCPILTSTHNVGPLLVFTHAACLLRASKKWKTLLSTRHPFTPLYSSRLSQYFLSKRGDGERKSERERDR